MCPHKEHDPLERDPGSRVGKFQLIYFERVGSRSYLRFTSLALIMIVCLTVVPTALLFALYLSNRRDGQPNSNVQIIVPPASNNYNLPILQPLPPAATPPRIRQRELVMPTPRTPRGSNENGNSPLTPSPTRSPTPIRTPT